MFPESTGRKFPLFVLRKNDGQYIEPACGYCFPCFGNVTIRGAGSDEGHDVAFPFDGTPELLFQQGDFLNAFRADCGSAGELVFVAEDAEPTGTAAPSHVITRMHPNPVTFDDFPDLRFRPVANGTIAVNVAMMFPVPTVRPVRFPDGIFCPLGTFFTPFSRQNECPDVVEPGLIDNGGGTGIDFQVAGTPSGAKVCGSLRES